MTRGSRPGGGEGAERTALLAAARAGSEDAFRDLFTPDLDLAWRMALRITGSEASADDALQAGLLSAYRSLDRVAPTNLRGWFVRIVENAARDLMRRERRHPTLPFANSALRSEIERIAEARAQRAASGWRSALFGWVSAAPRGALAGAALSAPPAN